MALPPVATDRDYPQAITKTNHVEPAPRRVRATLGGEQIFDTTRARYVWEWPYYPQYYIPAGDIDRRFLVDEDHEQRVGAFGLAGYGSGVEDVAQAPGPRLQRPHLGRGRHRLVDVVTAQHRGQGRRLRRRVVDQPDGDGRASHRVSVELHKTITTHW